MRLQEYLVLNEAPQGRGSVKTSLQESAQAIAFAILQAKGSPINKEDITIENMKSVSNFYDVGNSVESVMDFLNKNPDWMDSTVWGANAFKKSGYMKKSNYVFHRDSVFMNSIYNEYLRHNKTKMGKDKWNPGDVWASTLSSIGSFSDIFELNNFISEKFKSGELIAISLKKIKNTSPPIKVINEKPIEKVIFKRILKPKEPYSTGMTIATSRRNINFRSFQISKAVDIWGEIIGGGTSVGGKVKLSFVNEMLKKYNGKLIIGKRKIRKMGPEQCLSTAKWYYNKFGMNFSDSEYEKSFEKIQKKGYDESFGYWISKIQSLSVVDHIQENPHRDDIINEIYLYASSRGSVDQPSSVFLKIGK